MKMTKKISKKLIVSTLSTVMGVSLVGAITGTVAWYQYSTRSTVSFVGTSLGVSEKLVISLNHDSGFKGDLSSTDVSDWLAAAPRNHDTELSPVTSGAVAKDDELGQFKAQPIYQNFDFNDWINADAEAYVQFTVYLKLNLMDENGDVNPVEKPTKVYLNDLLIQADSANPVGKADISKAIRVHLASDHENMLLSKTGETTQVHGKLDLNGDGKADTDKPAYSFITDGVETEYGNGVQTAYKFDDPVNGVKPTQDQQGNLVINHYLGTLYSKEVTPEAGPDQEHPNVLDDTYFTDPECQNSAENEVADGVTPYYVRQDVLPVTVTIWLEGWQEFETGEVVQLIPAVSVDLSAGDYWLDENCTQHATGLADGLASYYTHGNAIWDPALYVGAMFDVGMMFEVEADL